MKETHVSTLALCFTQYKNKLRVDTGMYIKIISQRQNPFVIPVTIGITGTFVKIIINIILLTINSLQ